MLNCDRMLLRKEKLLLGRRWQSRLKWHKHIDLWLYYFDVLLVNHNTLVLSGLSFRNLIYLFFVI